MLKSVCVSVIFKNVCFLHSPLFTLCYKVKFGSPFLNYERSVLKLYTIQINRYKSGRLIPLYCPKKMGIRKFGKFRITVGNFSFFVKEYLRNPCKAENNWLWVKSTNIITLSS